MIKSFFKTAVASVMAVFLLNSQALADEQNQCKDLFSKVQETYTNGNFEATIINTAQNGMQMYALAHFSKGSIPYTTWKSLNNEDAGYALRQALGFDYNHNRSYVGPLSWHQTLIWDKVFNSKNELKGYDCTIAGRTRLAGRKVTVLRLAPVDDVRYAFIVSKDDDTFMPVELVVMTPSKMVTTRLTVSAMHAASAQNLDFPDETFDRIEKINAQNPKNLSANTAVWNELNVPSNFKLVASGRQEQADGTFLDFQSFTDGIVEFKVYKNSKATTNIQTATDGTLTVLRKNSDNHEYAVVGEIPLELSALVLSKISSSY